LSGESISKPGEDLEEAKEMSSRSLALIQKSIDNPTDKPAFYKTPEDYIKNLKRAYYMYADTYALLLYKSGNIDSAYYYQSLAYNNNATDAEGAERYAVFAYEAKGAAAAQPILEKQLLTGKGSPAMEELLKTVYKDLGLSESDYNKIIAKSSNKIKENLAEQIKEKMSNYAASDFSLKNLKGEDVSLTSLKGKVVVLDFWATWCGPCKASFPAMQTVVNKYKTDANVVFLFVDAWENKEPKPMREDAAKFIQDNNYTFHVLLDEKDKVIAGYNVSGIPTKFVIDPKGNVKYTSVGYESAEELIQELSLMVENAKNS
jgi:thiol-disulfide isomerase/thioredoxin